MKEKTNNKKTLIYFTLAIGLVAGIWKMSNSASKNYVDPNFEASKPVSEEKDPFTQNKKSALTKAGSKKSALTKAGSKKSALTTVKEIESKSKEKLGQDTVSSLRDSFDVTDSDQVKKVQNVLGLDEDGIFGPKTKSAWEAAVAEDDKNKTNSKNVSIAGSSKNSNPQPQKEKLIANGKSTLTTSISTKAKDPNSNAMLE